MQHHPVKATHDALLLLQNISILKYETAAIIVCRHSRIMGLVMLILCMCACMYYVYNVAKKLAVWGLAA